MVYPWDAHPSPIAARLGAKACTPRWDGESRYLDGWRWGSIMAFLIVGIAVPFLSDA
jgi:hypothetical protein